MQSKIGQHHPESEPHQVQYQCLDPPQYLPTLVDHQRIDILLQHTRVSFINDNRTDHHIRKVKHISQQIDDIELIAAIKVYR